MDMSAVVYDVCWYGYVLRRELLFDVEGQSKKRELKKIYDDWYEQGRCVLLIKVDAH